MKKILSLKKVKLIAILFLSTVFSLVAQTAQVVNSESKVTVDGTSNIHDWTVEAKSVSGKANYTIDSGILKEILSLDFSVDVDKLESGKSGMDSNIVDALNGKTNKTIVFKLIKVMKITKTADHTYAVETQGNLTIKGATKSISQTFSIKVDGKKVVFSGKQKIDMTVYGVEPPRALLGAIKTGKDVTVNFKVTYN